MQFMKLHQWEEMYTIINEYNMFVKRRDEDMDGEGMKMMFMLMTAT